MEHYVIDDREAVDDFLDYVKSMPTIVPMVNENVVEFNGDCFEVVPRYKYILRRFKSEKENTERLLGDTNGVDDNNVPVSNSDRTTDSKLDSLIFGKDSTESVVAIEIVGEEVWLFKADGSVEKRPNEYWLLAAKPIGRDCEKLEGSLFYKYKKTFTDLDTFKKARGILYAKRTPMYNIYDPVEAYMVMNGVTFFKGLKVNDVSVLSFDIESTGITHNSNSRVLLISNTYRDTSGKVTRKLFALDDYEDDTRMIEAWCDWVREADPSIMIGHNIFGFDLPYLNFCCQTEMYLGKDESTIKFGKKPKQFRKDGSQSYDYHEAKIFGRQIIDTWMLSIRYDFARKYESYGLKQIIAQEGLEKKGRTKWDFSKIMPGQIWDQMMNGNFPEDQQYATMQWIDFKKYCIEDSDDSLHLYDLMIAQYFYYMQSLPMPFQTMSLTATGRQINGFLCRSYLQDGHSIPKPSEKEEYQGAISFGNPGVYSHVYKVDVASLYPSIMITEEIYDREKDPKGHFLTMVKHFTKERLENKRLAKETGDRHYKDIEQAQKIVINSAYGLLGATGVNFNSMHNADRVTESGREILTEGIKWVEDNGYQVVNVDTDSFSYTTGKKKSKEDFEAEIADINTRFKDGISWEDDGYFQKFIVVKAKNYILFDGKKVKIKGQALKGTGKEKALTDFVNCVIMMLLKNKRDHIFNLYQDVALTIKNDWDVNEWNMKKTVTKAVLDPQRKQEQKVFDAIQSINYQEGDKVYMYVKDKDTLQLVDNFDGTYCKETYYGKLHDTLSIFKTLLDHTLFPNYKTGRNKDLI